MPESTALSDTQRTFAVYIFSRQYATFNEEFMQRFEHQFEVHR